jgi:hypothetical protein
MAENDPDDLSGLPLEPTPEQLPAAYALVRRKLARANRSRTALKGHDDYRGSLIRDLRAELEQLEADFRVESRERVAVHELNQSVLEIVQSLEDPLEEAAAIVEEKDKGGLSSWVVRFARLLPVVLRLRQAKAAARRLLGREAGLPALLLEPSTPLDQDQGQELEPAADPEPVLQPPAPQPDLFQPGALQPDSIAAVTPAQPSQAGQTVLLPPPGPQPPPAPPVATPLPAVPATPPSTADAPATASPDAAAEARRRKAYGPLLLQFTGASFGVLLLPSANKPLPEGLIPQQDNPWLPGHTVLAPRDHDDPEMAAIDAGFLAIEQDQPHDQAQALVPELQPWLERGLLPFALDPLLQLPRLVHNASPGAISHVLVREAQASAFEEQIGGSGFDVDSDLWLGFQLDPEEAEQFWRVLHQTPGRSREQAPRLATRGGVAMVDRRGYLATGLGLPLLTAPLACELERVQLKLADGLVLDYSRFAQDEDNAKRQIWQPSAADRRRVALPEGPAGFKGWLADGSSLQRTIQLTALPERVRFRRVHPIAYREDWGLPLGPLELPDSSSIGRTPSSDAVRWARQRLNQGDANVNSVFEQQMLESLSALFQRRPSLQRRDFLRLYAQLRNKPDEWPGFPESVLRGWCEGGWLEEGVEQRGGRWRLQPVDPRLVRLLGGGLQLVGLLSARRLVAVLAVARELGLTIRSVPPSCADMPRGWRFHGAVDQLGPTCGLPVVDTGDWVPDPSAQAWIIEDPLQSDSPSWPIGLQSRRTSEPVCGRRGEHHWKPPQPLPEGHRASIHLRIEAETSSYGKRRWHSHDPATKTVFTSCHRNRVALHALVVATDGLWPFGFTNSDIGQIDRLYDCEAYLPLPLARWAALTGRNMPGPTLHKPSDHSYRYHVSASLRSHQLRSRFLPLTSTP